VDGPPDRERHAPARPQRGGSFPLEVLLLGPDPAAPSGGYVARLTIAPDETPIDLDVDLDALLRALAPVLR